MSFNRGAKRNSFGSRNFNRSGGGGGGGGGGGNSSGRNNGGVGGGVMGGSSGGGGGVNPWESGMMPGRGLLPTPNNNLSLSSPQAQLVIASNLLSNLLRTQQDVQPQVPSLLSLGNTLNGPGPNFAGQQNFGPGRFNDRPMRHQMKNQRPQPYNKMGNRARDGVAGRRGPSSAQQSRAPQSANQRINGNQNQHRNDKTSKPNSASKQNQTGKKEQQEVKSSDKEKAETHVAKSDESEGGEEKKRDWKDEKKEGEVSQMDVSESEEKVKDDATDDADKSASDKKEDGQGGGKKSASRHAESRYSAVPMSNMFCHVCNKRMWDGFSFENHLRGRAHQLMMEKLDESYKLKVDLMRHELRVAEEQRELSLTNSKRRGKKVSVDLNVREYCTMCDLNFFGTLSTHRKSDKHQQLKTFLHPRCFPCMKEFPSRIEYDEHCLTPGHMKSSAQNEEQRKNKKKDKLAKGESEVRTADEEEKDSGPELKASDKEEESTEISEFFTDITDDVTLANHKIPSLKQCRQNQLIVGKSMVKETQGYHCEKCRRFMITEADMTSHLRSITHYRNFVQEIKTLTAAAEAAAKPAVEEIEEAKPTVKSEIKDEEEDDDYEGDWKRRKVDHSTDMDSTVLTEGDDSELNDSSALKKVDGDDKYDPLEADADSEDESGAKIPKVTSEKPVTVINESPDKVTPVEKMWEDIDNDNDPEIGNLIDDDGEEKEHQEMEEEEIKEVKEPEKPKPAPEIPQKQEEPPVVIPEVTPQVEKPATVVPNPSPQVKASPAAASPQVKAAPAAASPQVKASPAAASPQVKASPAPAAASPQVKASPAPAAASPQVKASPAPAAASPQVKASPAASPQVKMSPAPSPQVNSSPTKASPATAAATPRGRGGYGRGGRGTPRARRSRR